jgi:hypothetical protein
MVKTMTLTAKDQRHVQQQIWALRETNPKFVLLKQYPAETLPLGMKAVKVGQKLEAPDRISVRIDYQD